MREKLLIWIRLVREKAAEGQIAVVDGQEEATDGQGRVHRQAGLKCYERAREPRIMPVLWLIIKRTFFPIKSQIRGTSARREEIRAIFFQKKNFKVCTKNSTNPMLCNRR